MKHTLLRLGTYLLLLSVALGSSSLFARDYLIELVLFETKAGRKLSGSGIYYPKIGDSIRLNSEAASAAGFLTIEDDLTLTENANAMASSGRYRVLRHMAWRQPGLDESAAKAVRINLGAPTTVFLPDDLEPYEEFIPAMLSPGVNQSREVPTFTVNGTVKVRLGRFLHMESLLVFTDTDSGQSFKLSQNRKMRSRELHYIDNPRFGILTRILPLDDKILEPEADDTASDLPAVDTAQ